MSMVTVHGPNTMYTTEGGGASVPSSPVGAQATKSPTSGLVFNFSFPNPGANANTCFDWTFIGPGSPVPQADKFSGTVTFTGPGPVSIICTVTGATPPPTNQAYTINATATAGVPRDIEASQQPALEAPTEASVDQTGSYDPGEFTVAEVVAYATDNPEEVQSIIDAEEAGRSRTTLLNQLRAML